MNSFGYSVDFCLGVTKPSLLDSIFINFKHRRTWLKRFSPRINLFYVIVLETDYGFMLFYRFGSGIVEEDGPMIFLLNKAPVVLLKFRFLVG